MNIILKIFLLAIFATSMNFISQTLKESSVESLKLATDIYSRNSEETSAETEKNWLNSFKTNAKSVFSSFFGGKKTTSALEAPASKESVTEKGRILKDDGSRSRFVSSSQKLNRSGPSSFDTQDESNTSDSHFNSDPELYSFASEEPARSLVQTNLKALHKSGVVLEKNGAESEKSSSQPRKLVKNVKKMNKAKEDIEAIFNIEKLATSLDMTVESTPDLGNTQNPKAPQTDNDYWKKHLTLVAAYNSKMKIQAEQNLKGDKDTTLGAKDDAYLEIYYAKVLKHVDRHIELVVDYYDINAGEDKGKFFTNLNNKRVPEKKVVVNTKLMGVEFVLFEIDLRINSEKSLVILFSNGKLGAGRVQQQMIIKTLPILKDIPLPIIHTMHRSIDDFFSKIDNSLFQFMDISETIKTHFGAQTDPIFIYTQKNKKDPESALEEDVIKEKIKNTLKDTKAISIDEEIKKSIINELEAKRKAFVTKIVSYEASVFESERSKTSSPTKIYSAAEEKNTNAEEPSLLSVAYYIPSRETTLGNDEPMYAVLVQTKEELFFYFESVFYVYEHVTNVAFEDDFLGDLNKIFTNVKKMTDHNKDNLLRKEEEDSKSIQNVLGFLHDDGYSAYAKSFGEVNFDPIKQTITYTLPDKIVKSGNKPNSVNFGVAYVSEIQGLPEHVFMLVIDNEDKRPVVFPVRSMFKIDAVAKFYFESEFEKVTGKSWEEQKGFLKHII